MDPDFMFYKKKEENLCLFLINKANRIYAPSNLRTRACLIYAKRITRQ